MVGAVGGLRFRVVGGSFSDTTATPFNPNVQYVLTNAGVEQWTSTSSGGATLGNWVTPTSAAGSAYEARVTVNSGTTPNGTVGSWLSLGTSRAWDLSTVSVTTVTCNLTVEIRNATSLVVVASGTVILTATKTL